MTTQSFGKHERIRKRNDYLTVYQQGARSNSQHFTVIAYKNQVGISRLGVTVSKKVGDAVQRNRIKRLLREFFRLNKSRFSTPQDIVIIAKKDASSLTYQAVCRELEGLLIKKPDVS
ncbi:MAG: ribonuclease P protein component [Deltaproteobacteria bacterium]|jgi:ribonuclease P protein component|nr:ribonuclease P protein component [Deltaproteobacteria bacterium]